MSLTEYEKDPRLFLFTSLTAGSSHIISATSRMETILKANRIPFQAIDLATDEKARKLWQRRGQNRKLPGLVKDGFVLGDLEQIEDWNEFGELKENIGPVPASNAAPAGSSIVGVSTAPPIDHNVPGFQSVTNLSQPTFGQAPKKPTEESAARIALPGAAEIAAMNKAKKEKQALSSDVTTSATSETMASAPATKEESVESAKEVAKDAEHSEVATTKAEPTGATEVAPENKPAEPSTEENKSTAAIETAPGVKSTETVPETQPVETVPEVKSSETASTETPPQQPAVEATESETPAGKTASYEVVSAPAEDTTQKHTEDVVKEANPEDIKKQEQENEVKKEADEGADTEAAVKGVEELKVSEGEKTQEQDAKAATEAAKSVED